MVIMLVVSQSQEQKSHGKSTGVFQDEELLFSQTQQRDNDPDVDLFATTAKPAVSLSYTDKNFIAIARLLLRSYTPIFQKM